MIVPEFQNSGVGGGHVGENEVLASGPADTPIANRLRGAIGAHLRALHEAGDYTSANIRIFGLVPPAIRDGHRGVRRDYEALWTGLLRRGIAAGELRADINVPRLCAFLLGAMNSSLEWLEPKRDAVARTASELATIVLNGAATARKA